MSFPNVHDYSSVVMTFCWPFHSKDISLCNMSWWEHFSIQHLNIDILSSALSGAFYHAILHHWHFLKTAGYVGNSSALTVSILNFLITFLHTQLSFPVSDVKLSLWKKETPLISPCPEFQHTWELHLPVIFHVNSISSKCHRWPSEEKLL